MQRFTYGTTSEPTNKTYFKNNWIKIVQALWTWHHKNYLTICTLKRRQIMVELNLSTTKTVWNELNFYSSLRATTNKAATKQKKTLELKLWYKNPQIRTKYTQIKGHLLLGGLGERKMSLVSHLTISFEVSLTLHYSVKSNYHVNSSNGKDGLQIMNQTLWASKIMQGKRWWVNGPLARGQVY